MATRPFSLAHVQAVCSVGGALPIHKAAKLNKNRGSISSSSHILQTRICGHLVDSTSLDMALRLTRLFRAAQDAGAGVTNRLLLTLSSPSEAIMVRKAVDSVTVPGAEGTMTLTNNHSLIVSMLKPGTITVREGGENKEYFVSDGFVFYNHPTDGSGCCTAEISAVECVPTSALDKDRTQQVLSDLLAGPKDTEWDKTRIQLGTGLLNAALRAAP